MKLSRFHVFSLAGGGLWFAYIALRAWKLPITHDEAATCLNHMPRLVVDILSYKDPVPNNHILNTIGAKTFAGIFGPNQFSVRIPNLIGCLLYIFSAVRIAEKLSAAFWPRVFSVVVLLGSPYLAEFFGLCRGYGLASGLLLFSVYHAWRFMENGSAATLKTVMTVAGLSVMANFTLLNFFVPLVGLLSLHIWQNETRERAEKWQYAQIMAISTLILAALIYTPLKRIGSTDQLRFWGTTGFWKETMLPLVSATTHLFAEGGKNLGVRIIAGVAAALSIGGWAGAAYLAYKKRELRLGYRGFAVALLFLSFAVNVLQYFIVNTPFLNARTATFFYPLFALQLAAMGAWLWDAWGEQKARWAMGAVGALLLVNFLRCANVRESEWTFDAHTFTVLNYLKKTYEQENRTAPYTLDAHWALLNSYMFHIEATKPNYGQWADLVPWHGDQAPKGETDFFVTGGAGEAAALEGRYTKVLELDRWAGWYLMRKN